MKASVDKNLCISCGLCVDNHPSIFKFDRDGLSTAYNEGEESEIVDAINNCPTAAISINNSKIDENSIIGDIIEKYPDVIEILANEGMHCVMCSASSGESIKDACLIHGLDVGEVINKINEKIDETR